MHFNDTKTYRSSYLFSVFHDIFIKTRFFFLKSTYILKKIFCIQLKIFQSWSSIVKNQHLCITLAFWLVERNQLTGRSILFCSIIWVTIVNESHYKYFVLFIGSFLQRPYYSKKIISITNESSYLCKLLFFSYGNSPLQNLTFSVKLFICYFHIVSLIINK